MITIGYMTLYDSRKGGVRESCNKKCIKPERILSSPSYCDELTYLLTHLIVISKRIIIISLL